MARSIWWIAVLALGCGRLRFDAVGGANDAAASDGATANVELTAGSVADAPGRATQTHLIYATNSATWWLFYIDDATNILRSAYSADLVHWTLSTTAMLSLSLTGGTSFGVGYKSIGGVDVVHVALGYTATIEQHDHLRGVLSSSSITWGSELQVGCAAPYTRSALDGAAVVIGADNTIYDFTSSWDDSNACTGAGEAGNFDVTSSTSIDLGASWTPGWTTPSELDFTSGEISAHWGAPTASGALAVETNGDSNSDSNNLSNLWWSTWSGTAWSTVAHVLTADLATPIDASDWGAVHVDNTDDRVVLRTGANTYTWFVFDGTAWSTPVVGIPDQPSLAHSGPFLASDGANIWLFVIDSDAAATIRYNKFDGTAWGTWTAFETSTQTRTFLTGYSVVSNNSIGLLWAEARGATYNLVVERFSTQ